MPSTSAAKALSVMPVWVDVQDVEEYAPAALQATLEAGIGGMVELAEQIVGQHRPEGRQPVVALTST
jgi:hypothetical protein